MRFSEPASSGDAYVIGVPEIIPSMAERYRSYAESACHAEKGTCKESLCVMKTSGGEGRGGEGTGRAALDEPPLSHSLAPSPASCFTARYSVG